MNDTAYLIGLIDGVMNSEEVGTDDLYADCIDIKEGIVEMIRTIKVLTDQRKTAQGVLEYLYNDVAEVRYTEDAEWIQWFCHMEDEEE